MGLSKTVGVRSVTATGLNVCAFKVGEEMRFVSTSVLNSLNPTQMAHP